MKKTILIIAFLILSIGTASASRNEALTKLRIGNLGNNMIMHLGMLKNVEDIFLAALENTPRNDNEKTWTYHVLRDQVIGAQLVLRYVPPMLSLGNAIQPGEYKSYLKKVELALRNAESDFWKCRNVMAVWTQTGNKEELGYTTQKALTKAIQILRDTIDEIEIVLKLISEETK